MLSQLIAWAQKPDEQIGRLSDERSHSGVERALPAHVYPSASTSRLMALKNLAFSWRNLALSLAIGLTYFIVTWEFFSLVERHDISAGAIDAVGFHTDLFGVWKYMPFYFLQGVLVSIPLAAMVLGCWLMCWKMAVRSAAGFKAALARALVGTSHFLAHAGLCTFLGLAFVMTNNVLAPHIEFRANQAWLSQARESIMPQIAKKVFEPMSEGRSEQRQQVGDSTSREPTSRRTAPPAAAMPATAPSNAAGLDRKAVRQLVGFVLFPIQMILLGGIAGGALFGIYLTVTAFVSHRHAAYAFAAFRPKGYRTFLRLEFRPDRLTIYPIGARRLASAKRARDSTGVLSPSALTAELVEPPIVLNRLA